MKCWRGLQCSIGVELDAAWITHRNWNELLYTPAGRHRIVSLGAS